MVRLLVLGHGADPLQTDVRPAPREPAAPRGHHKGGAPSSLPSPLSPPPPRTAGTSTRVLQ